MFLEYRCKKCDYVNREHVFDKGIVFSQCKECNNRITIKVELTNTE